MVITLRASYLEVIANRCVANKRISFVKVILNEVENKQTAVKNILHI